MTRAPRPDWTNVLPVLAECRKFAPPDMQRAAVDQIQARVRDLLASAGIDVRGDEWALFTIVITVCNDLKHVTFLERLGLMCPASARSMSAVLAGDLHMLADFLPDDIAAQVAAA